MDDAGHDWPGGERPRPLRPYKPGRRYQHAPIIVVDENHASYWREDTDTAGTDFGDLLHVPKSLIVVDSSAAWAEHTESLGAAHPTFDYGCRVFETRVIAPDLNGNVWVFAGDAPGEAHSSDPEFMQLFEQEICFEWGQRPRLRPDKMNDNWHMVIDPAIFYGVANTAIDLYQFAAEFRQWCYGRNIPISLSKGSAAGRILRGLVREPSSKVPFATNENCRRALGANMTRADTHGRTHKDVTEFDQRSAQHLVARDVPMPDRNTFTAQGDYIGQTVVCFEAGTEPFIRLTTQNERGVLLVTVEPWTEALYRRKHPWSPYQPWVDEPVWLATNELSLAKRCGLRLTGIIAAWTSPDRCTELAAHARVSLDELATASTFTKGWLKPVCLAVYGGTASTARAAVRRTYRDGQSKRGTTERMTNHVAWLAMIQREVRKRSVHFAMDLEEVGVVVVGIYVDAVFAKVGNHNLTGYVPAYFDEKAHGDFAGKGTIKVFGDDVSFPGVPLSDPDRRAKALAYVDGSPNTNI